MGFPILTVIIFLPFVAAVVVALLPEDQASLAKSLGVAAAVAEVGLVAYLITAFNVEAGFQFISQHEWISQFGISWNVGVDGISLFLVAVTALVFPVAMVGPTIRGSARSFMAWMLLLEAICMGVFLSLDLFLFFFLFEASLVPAYFLIAGWGGFRRNYAAMKFFIFTFAGSAFLLVALISLVVLTAPLNGGHQTFDLITLTRLASSLPHADQELIFAGFAIAFAVKIPLVPFHSWLPDAYTEAPTAGSMIIAGILFKLGAYGLLRFGVFMLPKAAVDLAPVLLTLAAIGVVYGSVVTIVQRDFKRLVAYASIVDVAFIVIGFFAFSGQGITGGVFEMVNHGLTTGALFFCVGMVWERRGTLKFSELGGLQRTMPYLAAVVLAVLMSAVGLPGLNGFVGEFLVLAGTFLTHRWWAVVVTVGIITGVIYLLWAYKRVFHGPLPAVAAASAAGVTAASPSEAGPSTASAVPEADSSGGERVGSERVPAPGAPSGGGTGKIGGVDISWRELGAIAPLLAGIVFLGVYPKPFLDRITPSVSNVIAHVQHVDPSFHIPSQGLIKPYAVPANQNVNGRAPAASASALGPGGQP